MIIAALVVFFAVLLTLNYSVKFNEKSGIEAAGFIGGILMPSMGLGGSPVVLYLLNQKCCKDEFRATLSSYFIVGGLGSFAALQIAGRLTSGVFISSLTFLPILAVGFFLGIKLCPRLNQSLFRKLALAIVLIAGLVGILSGYWCSLDPVGVYFLFK